MLGVFRKYPTDIKPDAPHVVLVNPADMGNLGTIIRTLAGFNIFSLAVITPAADIWNPKTIRASMGSLFHMGFRCFADMDEYLETFPDHRIFPFMPDGEVELKPESIPRHRLFSLVFGNEASGLGECFRHLGVTVRIPQSARVDSLNLSAAVVIGAYAFTLDEPE